MKKLILALITVGSLLAGADIVYAAPVSNIMRNVLPEVTDRFDLGSSTPALEWNGLYVKTICLSGDCKSAWPSGGSGGGSGAATSSFTATYPVKVTTSTSAINYSLLNMATTTVTCSGSVACSQFFVIGTTPITITGTDNTASTTLLGDNNTFSGNDIFNNTITGSVSGNAGSATVLQTGRAINGVTFNGSIPITINAASSTALGDRNTWSALQAIASASTTNLTASNLWLIGQSAGCAQFDTNAKLTSTGVNCGTGGTFTEPFWVYQNSAVSTTSPVMVLASTTIGNGLQNGGLTVNGGSTTTLNAYFQSPVGINGISNRGAFGGNGILTVNGDASNGGVFEFFRPISSGASNIFTFTFGDTSNSVLGQINGRTDVSGSTGQLIFKTSNGSSNATAMTINSNQQVMVGTTTAFSTFTVASSSGSQIALLDGSPTSNAWTMRSIANSLFFATSSNSSSATSSISDFILNGRTGALTLNAGATSTFTSGLQATNFNMIGTTATNTAASGINLTSGCFAIAGTCVGGSGAASLSGGTNGMLAAWTSASTLTATGTPTAANYIATSTLASQFPYASTTALTVSGILYEGSGGAGTVYVGDTNHFMQNNGDLILQANSGSFRENASGGGAVFMNDSNGGKFQIGGSLETYGSLWFNDSRQLSIGTTTPWGRLSIAGQVGNSIPLFDVSASTAAGTTTALIIDQNGLVGVATSTPGSVFSIGNVANFSSATSTFYSGIQTTALNVTTGTSTFQNGITVSGGCFAENTSCIKSIYSDISGLPTGVKFVSISTFNKSAGTTTIYTVPAGRSAVLVSTAYAVFNPTASPILWQGAIRKGTSDWYTASVLQLTAGVFTFPTMNINSAQILEAGDSVVASTSASGVNFSGEIMEIPAGGDYFTASTTITQANTLQTLYTAPVGSSAIPTPYGQLTTSAVGGSGACVKVAAGAVNSALYLTPSGQSPFQIVATSSNASFGPSSFNSPRLVIGSGDTLSVMSDTVGVGCFIGLLKSR